MVQTDFGVASAKENPINLSAVPRERLELLMPARAQPSNVAVGVGSTIGWILVTAVVTLLALALLQPATDSSLANFLWFILIVYIVGKKIRNAQQRHPLSERLIEWELAARVSMIILAFVYLSFYWGWLTYLPSVCLAMLAWQGICFRRHVIKRATAGMLDKATIRRFRVWKRIPKGLTSRSRIAGLLHSLHDYLSYNRNKSKSPGVLQSPAGSQPWRVLITCTLISLLSVWWYAVSIPLFESLETDGMIADATTASALNMLASPLVGISIWAGGCFLFTFRFIGRAYALERKQISSSHWRRMLDRLSESKNLVEQKSLWVGWVEWDGAPILYPISQLFKHAWIVGKTGSGKSAWIMGVMLDQLIYRTDIQVIVIDLKATSFEMLSAMQTAADEKLRKTGHRDPIKYFTLAEGEQTYLFDIFSQGWWRTLATPQRCSVILSALAMAYSQAYGQSFYRDSAYDFLAYVLDRHPDVKSWKELLSRMQDAIRWAKEPHELSKRCKEDAEHIVFVVRRLASFSALNLDNTTSSAVQREAINFQHGHYYFALSATENSFIAGEVGRLVAAAILASARHSGSRRIVLIIDEWQEMCTKDLELLLSQARGLGIGVVLSNQNAAQLITKDMDMRPIVEGNTSLQAWMSVTDAVGREQLQRLGGKEIAVLISQSHKEGSEPSLTFSQTVQDRANGNLVSAITSDARQFLIRMTDNAGYACYGDLLFAARSMFHQTKARYDVACQMNWPGPTKSTLVNKNSLPKHKATTNRSTTVAPNTKTRPSKKLGNPTSP